MKRLHSFLCHALTLGVCVLPAWVADGAAQQAGSGGSARAAAAASDAVIVRNGPTGRWRPGEAWRVVEELRIGSVGAGEADGPWFTNALIGATLGPNGEIFVLDFPADQLTRVDGDGGNPRLVAREGAGPGELQVPAGMGWDDQQRLWVAGGRGRYTVFDSRGELVDTHTRPAFGLERRQYPLVFEDGGTFIDEAPEDGGIRFLRIGRDGEIVETLGVLSLPGAFDGLPPVLPNQKAFRYLLNHYVPETRWAVTPHGSAWVVRTDRLRLYELDLRTGKTLRIVETVHRSGAQLSREDERRIRDGLAEAGLRRSDIQVGRPVVQSLHRTDDGFILVQIVEEVGEDGSLFDVFNSEGHFMGTVNMPFRLPRHSGLTVVGNTILGVSLTDLDEPYVVRARIIRP